MYRLRRGSIFSSLLYSLSVFVMPGTSKDNPFSTPNSPYNFQLDIAALKSVPLSFEFSLRVFVTISCCSSKPFDSQKIR